MTDPLIARINALARKAKTEGLTDAEREEQTRLRNVYRERFRSNLVQTLEHTVIVDADGNVIRRLHQDSE